MATIAQIAEHTGLSVERISNLMKETGDDFKSMSLDTARIEVIRALRAGASGTLKREDTEREHARLLQAKRIKTDEQIRAIKAGRAPTFDFSGYLLDTGEDITALKTEENATLKALRCLSAGTEYDFPHSGCLSDYCPYVRISDDDYIQSVKNKG